MRIIVCGAGLVGRGIVRQLSNEGHDVTVIDDSPDTIQKVIEVMDVNSCLGVPSHPSVLEQAGAVDADMIIAVTLSDELNMMICQVAHSLFSIKIKIARIRHENYLMPEWENLYHRDHLPIDYKISPEVEVAKNIFDRLHAPGAINSIPFGNERGRVISIRCMLDCPVTRMPVEHIESLKEDVYFSILAFKREGEIIFPAPDTVLLADDEVYFACAQKNIRDVMGIFGHEEEEARRVVIVGGGNIGLSLAEHLLADEEHKVNLKMIEVGKSRAEYIANKLLHTTVICVSALDQDILEEINIANTETIVVVTNNDEVNILASVLAKKLGCQRTIVLINNSQSYMSIVSSLGVDVTIVPREVTVSTILQHIRRGHVVDDHTIFGGEAEVIEAIVSERAHIVHHAIKDLKLPNAVRICAIVRDGQVIKPADDTIILERDIVVVMALTGNIKEVEALFEVESEFF